MATIEAKRPHYDRRLTLSTGEEVFDLIKVLMGTPSIEPVAVSDTTLTYRMVSYTSTSRAEISFVTDENLDTPEVVVMYDPSLRYLIDKAFPKENAA